MIDWRDPARRDEIRFQMVDPNDLDTVYADLTDVQLGSSSITYGYNTDTRYASGISFLKSNNYIENAWVRIIHDVPSENYSNELGTFIPSSPSEKRKGAVIVNLDLQSPLWGLKDDMLTAKFSIGKNTPLLDAMIRIMDSTNRPYLLNNPNNAIAYNAIVYDVGETKLKILHDLANQTSNRLDVDGHGRLIIEPIPKHARITPQWTLDYDDPRSMIIEGSLKMESEIVDLPSRAIVVNGNNIGYADLADGVSYSAHQRGYIKAQKYEDSNANTAAKAAESARRFLNEATKAVVWSMDALYFPCQCGDNVNFILDGEKHVCMIESIDPLRLQTMTMGLTLREVFYE